METPDAADAAEVGRGGSTPGLLAHPRQLPRAALHRRLDTSPGPEKFQRRFRPGEPQSGTMTKQEYQAMETPQANPHQKEEPKPIYVRLLKFLFGHVGMFLLVSFVAAFGAWVFIQMETPHEDQMFLLRRTKIRDKLDGENYFTSYWWHYAAQENLTFPEWNKKIKGHLEIIESFVIDMVNNYGYDGTKDDWPYEWDFSSALLFTVTIMTTIGYGHISPKTTEGQLFTIGYAMIGTPLLLVFLANIGDGMGKVFTYTYSRICCRWCRSTRYKQQQKPGRRAQRVSDDVVGKEEYMPTDEVNVPITINLMMIALYLGLGALIFSRWEQWDMMASYYFSFVTLSTIGFGDMVPGNSFMDKASDDAVIKAVKMGITIGYCLIGMALISMCIQIMQEQTVAKVRWAASEFGLVEGKDQKPKMVMRRTTRRDGVPETKYFQDGYYSRPVSSEKRRKRRKREDGDALSVRDNDSRRDSRSPSPRPASGRTKDDKPRSPSPKRNESPKREAKAPSPQPPPPPPQKDDLMLDSDDDLFNLA
ncbi:TWiK family of potassium channels protein 7-like isoform X2 [Amphibalanus amphitrite]|uniref:TWiK family of potassium channels protein 7-like isoform X2 n=1 Tax=Amphibalanus amphitrite TaxID=1232801 RepID=UPI001C90F737|nr:TWiK family of potassium channels protein 7-like isoform X2 [Amphibalanus amphitrite]